jgi:hypothetical protein
MLAKRLPLRVVSTVPAIAWLVWRLIPHPGRPFDRRPQGRAGLDLSGWVERFRLPLDRRSTVGITLAPALSAVLMS